MNIASGAFTLLALLLVHSFSLGFLGIQYSRQNHNTNWSRLAPQSPWGAPYEVYAPYSICILLLCKTGTGIPK